MENQCSGRIDAESIPGHSRDRFKDPLCIVASETYTDTHQGSRLDGTVACLTQIARIAQSMIISTSYANSDSELFDGRIDGGSLRHERFSGKKRGKRIYKITRLLCLFVASIDHRACFFALPPNRVRTTRRATHKFTCVHAFVLYDSLKVALNTSTKHSRFGTLANRARARDRTMLVPFPR